MLLNLINVSNAVSYSTYTFVGKTTQNTLNKSFNSAPFRKGISRILTYTQFLKPTERNIAKCIFDSP